MYQVLIVVISILINGCGMLVSEERAIKAAETSGFSNVQVDDKDIMMYFGCSDDDDAKFELTALNPRNQRVEIEVCCGWGWFSKSCTIRTE